MNPQIVFADGTYLEQSIIYGPVASRRYGVSLGINISGDSLKQCSFNCGYCFRGWNEHYSRGEEFLALLPTVEQVEAALIQWQAARSLTDAPLGDICIAGNGEPTDHPDFARIVDFVIDFRNQFHPGVGITCLSNGYYLYKEDVRNAFLKLERPCCKLDAGDETTLKRINVPMAGFDFNRYVALLCSMEKPLLQTMIHGGKRGNVNALESWFEVVGKIQPGYVYFYTVNKATAAPGTEAVSEETLTHIARQLYQRHQVKSNYWEADT